MVPTLVTEYIEKPIKAKVFKKEFNFNQSFVLEEEYSLDISAGYLEAPRYVAFDVCLSRTAKNIDDKDAGFVRGACKYDATFTSVDLDNRTVDSRTTHRAEDTSDTGSDEESKYPPASDLGTSISLF